MVMTLRKAMRRVNDALRTTRLFADDGLIVSALDGQAGDGSCTVVFTSLHGSFARGGQLEFAKTATDGGARASIFVRDKRQRWFQDPGAADHIERAVRGFADRQGISRITAVGDSMGAYAAMVLAGRIGAGSVLAFSPQFDVSRAAMPDDPRWADLRDAIPEFTLGAIDGHLSSTVDYYVLHGDEGPDILHWSRFPTAPNLHHYLLPGIGHGLARAFKLRGVLAPCFDAVRARDTDRFETAIAPFSATRRGPEQSYMTTPNDWYLTKGPAADRSDAPQKEPVQ